MSNRYYSIENVRRIIGIPEPLLKDAQLINLIAKANHDAGPYCEKGTDEHKCRFKNSLLGNK